MMDVANIKTRRVIARIFLPFFVVFLVLAPRNAYAFVLAQVGGYGLPSSAAIAGAGGAGVTNGAGQAAAASFGGIDLFAGAAVIAAGAALSYYALDFWLGDGTPTTLRIPLTANNAVPAPAAPPTATQQTNNTFQASALGIYSVWSSTSGAACQSWLSRSGNPSGYNVTTCTDTAFVVSGSTGSMSSNSTTTCPAGYTVSGGTCNLTNARAAVPDHACDISRSGTALAMISDPDCTSATQAMNQICNTSASFTCQGVNAQGQPRSVVITPTSDGGSTIATFTQGPVINNTPTTQVTQVTVSPTGTISSVGGGTQTGAMPSPAGATGGTASASVPTIATPAPGQAVAPSAPPITLPTDYARQGEAAAAAAPLANKLDTLHNDVTAQTTAQNTDRTNAESKAQNLGLPQTTSIWDITRIVMPKQADYNLQAPPISNLPSKVACTPIVMPLAGHNINVDTCLFISVMTPIADWSLVMLGVASGIWQILDSRRRGA